MNTTLNPTEQDIQAVLDEFFQTGYSLEDFCSLTGHEQTELQSWIEDYQQQMPADPNAFLEVNVIGTPQTFPSSKSPAGSLFARIGDIELYHYVPADYLKSLKS